MKPTPPRRAPARDAFAARNRRLDARLRACARPILWLCASAGTGKSRLLARWAAQRGLPPMVALDDPGPAALRRALAQAGRTRGPLLVIASRPGGAAAQLLLQSRLYGQVDLLGDADLFLQPREMRAALRPSGGWPLLADAAMQGRTPEVNRLLPGFLRKEVLPALAEEDYVALLDALVLPGAPANQDAAGPPWVDATAGTVAGSWVAQALTAAFAGGFGLPEPVAQRFIARHADHPQPARLIAALLDLGLRDAALAVYERSGGLFFGFRHGFAALQETLARFGEELENRRESLLLARVSLLFKNGQAREALRRLEAHYPRLPVDLRRLQVSHRVYPVLLRIDLAVDLDEALSGEVVTSWGRLDAFLPAEDHIGRGILFNTMTLGFLRIDQLGPAQQLAEEALAAYRRAPSPYLVHFMLVHLADIAIRQSRLHSVPEYLREAERELRSSGLLHNSEQAILDAFGARLAYETGRLEDCPAGVDSILSALVEGDCWPGLFHTIMGYAPFVAFWRQGLRVALDTAERCLLALGRRHGPTGDYGLALMRIRLYQIARRHSEAQARLRELELDARREGSAHLRLEEQLIRLRARILAGATDDELAAEARGVGDLPELETRQRICLNLLRAYLYDRRGEQGPAHRHLAAALRTAHSHACLGVLLEDAEVLERLLPAWLREGAPAGEALEGFARKLVGRLRRMPATGLRSRALAGVSRQEHRVLLHLSDGGSNKEIARALGSSESAVKFHLHNLFRKMKVERRAELVERARQRGLLN